MPHIKQDSFSQMIRHMCKVSNIQSNFSTSFDEWFSNLQDKDIQFDIKQELDDVTFEQLLAPIPPYEVYTPETIEPVEYSSAMEPMEYPSPISYSSIPSPVNNEKKRLHEEEVDDQILRKRKRQNEAAKRCRQKKLDLIQEAQEQAEQEQKERHREQEHEQAEEEERTTSTTTTTSKQKSHAKTNKTQ